MTVLVHTGDAEDKFNVPSDDHGSHTDDSSVSVVVSDFKSM